MLRGNSIKTLRVALLCGFAYVPAAYANDDSSQVDEIIVTAQKRAENVQQVPISISVLNDKALGRSGVTSLDSLQRLAPGLTMATVGSGFVSYTYMRGSGTNQIDSGTDPSVAFFVDEVYQTGTAGLQFDLFDVERIEVLKGPQGTLFGRNAAAGAISIVTKRPSATFEGSALVEVGNYDTVTARASLTGPMNESGSVRYRISGAAKEKGNVTRNLAGADPGDIHSVSGRAQLEFVGEKATFLLTADIFRARNGMTNQFISSAYKGNLVATADLPLLPPGESFYQHYYDVDGFENQDTQSIVGRLEWETGLGDVTAISAYRHNAFDRLQDQDGTILSSAVLATEQRDRSFSQELRLAKDVDAFSLIAGVYYFHSVTDREDQLQLGPYYPTLTLRNRVGIDRSKIKTTSYAGFGHLTFHATDKLNLTAGVRYTHDKKSDERYVARYAATPYSVSPGDSWSSFDPAVTVDYQAMPNLMLYASYRRGFKSGGFQTLLPLSAAIASITVEPERVSSYEAGFKSEWFDRKLLANVSIFRSDITNQQILRTTFIPNLGNNFVIDNAGRTRADGVDITLSAAPVAGLRLDANMTYQEARFRKYDSGAISYAGKHQLRSPDFTGSFGAEYTLELPSQAKLTARGEYTYQSVVYFDNPNTRLDGVYQPGFGLANARLTYLSPNGAWELSAWVRNITDEQYFRNIAVAGIGGLGAPGDPRTFGGTLQIKF